MILYRPSFVRAWKAIGAREQACARIAIGKLEAHFGRPHLHAGLGIRPIGKFFDFRVGLGIRCLFVAQGGDLILVTLGNHDQIRRYIKDNQP